MLQPTALEPTQVEVNDSGIDIQRQDYETIDQVLSEALAASTLVHDFKNSNSTHEIRAARGLLKIPSQDIANNLTVSTLSGPGKFATEPRVFFCDEVGSLVALYHLGPKLAGHAGMVHGGLLMTLLDECMGRACFPLLPGKVAVTGKFEVNFKQPIFVNTVIFIKAWTESVEGRKAKVRAVVLDSAVDSRPYIEACGIFIQPRDSVGMAVLI